MNILREYTLDYVKRNKKSSITIMIAMLIATILMNSVGMFAYLLWDNQLQTIIKYNGNWHGELFDATSGKKLDYVKSYASVEEVMVKGQWYVAEVGDEKRPYLIMRDADVNYWESMSDKNSIMEGRIPKQTGEIVISKQFMAMHPEYKIGDQITLPIGQRINHGEVLDERSIYIEGESFTAEEEVTYTIVGVLDITTSSITPGYVAMGYLEHEDILAEDDLTIYIRFKNMRDTYKELPKIAEGVGYTKDEYGDYLVRYNSTLLSRYLIFPKHEGKIHLIDLATPIMVITVVAIIIGVFVFIIHNAFETSMNNRKKQLGMFKSIGATPRQIKSSIIFEATILSIIPIVLGLIISNILGYWFIGEINKVNSQFEEDLYVYKMSLWVELIVIACVFIIAWLSAYMPSRKISKKMPIEILKGEINSKTLTKKKKRKLFKIRSRKTQFKNSTPDIYKEIASNQFKANKKSFRTAIISLTLSFLLFMTFLTLMASHDFVNEVYDSEVGRSNIVLHIKDGNEVDREIHQALAENNKIKDFAEVTSSEGTVWLKESEEADAFKAAGGFKAVTEAKKYYIYEENEQYRIRTTLVALNDEVFKSYCEQVGVNWQDYYGENQLKTIIYNTTADKINSRLRDVKYIEFLNIQKGDKLRVGERVYVEDASSGETEIEVGDIVNELPDWDIYRGNYTLIQIMPLSTYKNVIANWQPDNALSAMITSIKLDVDDTDILEISNWITEECEKLYGSGDYTVWDKIQQEEADKAMELESMIVAIFITVLFAIIGISNAFFTVYISLEQRSRSFAILRSIGVSNKGINKLLMIEVVHFAIRPIIYAVILEIIVTMLFAKIVDSSLLEFGAYLPIGKFIIFAILIICAISLTYIVGSQKIRRQNIIEVIKDENL